MTKLARILVGAVAALGLFAGTAHAGETVFTDDGWYRVEGAETPVLDTATPALTTEPRAAATTTSTNAAPAQQAAPSGGEQQGVRYAAPSCLAERGELVRRLLELHGVSLSRIELNDEQLGMLGTAAAGAPQQYGLPVSIDPDLNLAMGNVPIPPSAANYDLIARQSFVAMVDCLGGR